MTDAGILSSGQFSPTYASAPSVDMLPVIGLLVAVFVLVTVVSKLRGGE